VDTLHLRDEGQLLVPQMKIGLRAADLGEIAGFRLEVASGLYFAPDGRCVSAGGA